MPVAPAQVGTNRLLASLPRSAQSIVAERLTERYFDFGEVVYQQGSAAQLVVFPVDSAFSLVAYLEDGRGAEVATIGNEGLIGVAMLLRPGRSEHHRAFAQVAGAALTLRGRDFAAVARTNQPLRIAVAAYAQALLTQISQGSVCNRLHSLEQRCIRWLLQTHDRVGTDQFQLTQEFLGLMLGVGRQAVNRTARGLQDKELIRYGRGRVTILDRPGMEAAACECYATVRGEFDELLRPRR